MGFRTEYLYNESVDIARGLVPRMRIVNKFGNNATVPNGSWEHIWSHSAAYTWPTSAQTVRVKAGGNAADTNTAGAGARKVIVFGLDAEWNEAQKELTLAGASASAASTTTFIRVFRAYVSSVGTYSAANTGIIAIENTTSTNVLTTIAAGVGQSEVAHYTVPKGFTAYLHSIIVDVQSTNSGAVRMFRRQNADDVTAPYSSARLIHRFPAVDGSSSVHYESLVTIPEKTDIWCEGYGNGGATEIAVRFELYLIEEK